MALAPAPMSEKELVIRARGTLPPIKTLALLCLWLLESLLPEGRRVVTAGHAAAIWPTDGQRERLVRWCDFLGPSVMKRRSVATSATAARMARGSARPAAKASASELRQSSRMSSTPLHEVLR